MKISLDPKLPAIFGSVDVEGKPVLSDAYWRAFLERFYVLWRELAFTIEGLDGGGASLPLFSPTIIPFAGSDGVLTESASLFWDGSAANMPGLKVFSGGNSTLLRQNSNVLEAYVAATRMFNFTLNAGSGNAIYNFSPSASGILGISGAAGGNDLSTYALNTDAAVGGTAGFWAAHNSVSGGSAYLDLYRYAASVQNNGWRVAAVQSRSDALSIYTISAGGSSALTFEFRRDAGLFFKPVSRPTADGTFGYVWADTEGSPALSGPNGDTFRYNHAAKYVKIGKSAGNANSSGTQCVAIGYEALKLSVDSFGDVAIGSSVMNAGTSSGGSNVAIGVFCLGSFTEDAVGNIAIGDSAMGLDTVEGTYNIGLSREALGNLTTGDRNIGIGELALNVLSSGDDNVGLGAGTLASLTTTSNNTAIGAQASADQSSGTGRTAVGYQAASNIPNGDYDTAIGFQALGGSTGNHSDGYNVAVGYKALFNPLTGAGYNIAIGESPMSADAVSGAYNIGIGQLALAALTSGSNNICIGQNAGNLITDNVDCIVIGRDSSADAANDDVILLGNGLNNNGEHEMWLGGSTITEAYIRGRINLYGNITGTGPGAATDKLKIVVDGVEYYVALTAV